MSKSLIVLMVGMLVVGCGKQEKAAEPLCLFHNESTPTINTNKVDGTTKKPPKELTLEEKVVGTYEGKIAGYAVRIALLDNGVLETYDDGKKREDGKWKIVDGDIHWPNASTTGSTGVLIINKDGSLTAIASIEDGKREAFPKEDQLTFKKIK